MIYDTTQLKKDLRLSFMDVKKSKRHVLTLMFLLAIASISIHFLFLSLQESAFDTLFPYLADKSGFSVLSVLRVMAYVFFTVWCIVYFDAITFIEMGRNRWYLLRKMGFSPWRMALSKLFATLIIVFVVYSGAFILCLSFSMILGYDFPSYSLVPLYLAGLLDILLTVDFEMLVSLAVKDKKSAIPAIVVAAGVFWFIRAAMNYPAYLSQLTSSQSVRRLFFHPVFMGELALTGLLFVLCCGVSIFLSKRYVKAPMEGIVYQRQFSTGAVVKYNTVNGANLVYTIGKGLLILLLALLLLAEFAVIAISFRSGGDELSAGRFTAFVVQSDTLSGVVEKYDVALFERVDSRTDLREGDVVIFRKDGKISIERIMAVNGNTLSVDITNYNSITDGTSFQMDIQRSEAVYRMLFTSGFMGVIYLMTTSAVGKVFFVVIPLLVLSFYDALTKLYKQLVEINSRGG